MEDGLLGMGPTVVGSEDSLGFDTLANMRRYVREKLRSGVYKLAPEKRGRSAVWEHFRMVMNQRGNMVGYAGCTYCLEVLRHDPHMTGTSSLFTHLRSCPGASKQSVDDGIVSEVQVVKEEVVVEEEQKDQFELELEKSLSKVCSEFVIRDMFPYQTLIGDGFKNLAQFLIDVGAVHGKVDISPLFPEPKKLAMHIAGRATATRTAVASVVKGQIQSMAVTASVIQDCPDSYVALSLHHISGWRTLEQTFIGISKIQKDSPTTIKDCVRSSLQKFGFREADMKFVLVTNDESTVEEQTNTYTTLPCFDHMINKALRHLFNNTSVGKEVNGELLKYAGLLKLINVNLPNTADWKNVLSTIVLVTSNPDKLSELAQNQEQKSLLTEKGLSKIKAVSQLLLPYLKALDDIEKSTGPTLHKVVPWLTHLREGCVSKNGDDPFTVKLKVRMKKCLEEYVDIQLHHKVAVFFNPRMNSLRIMNSEDRTAVHKEIKDLAQNVSADMSQPRKKQKCDSPLAYLEDDDQDEERAAEREIQLYTLMRDYSDSDDLLVWWQRNSSLLPNLAHLARTFLVIPASSKPTSEIQEIVAKVDRQKSWGGEACIDDLAFLHSRTSLPLLGQVSLFACIYVQSTYVITRVRKTYNILFQDYVNAGDIEGFSLITIDSITISIIVTMLIISYYFYYDSYCY